MKLQANVAETLGVEPSRLLFHDGVLSEETKRIPDEKFKQLLDY